MTVKPRSELVPQLANALLDLAAMEGAAAGVAHNLGRSRLLTRQEQDFAIDVVQRDEVRHMQWLCVAATELGRPRTSEVGRNLKRHLHTLARLAPSPDSWMIAGCVLSRMNHDERYLLRMFDRFRYVLDQFLPRDLLASFDDIERDERGHVAWSKGVLRRLEAEHPDWKPDIRRCRTLKNSATHETLIDLNAVYRSLDDGSELARDMRRVTPKPSAQ